MSNKSKKTLKDTFIVDGIILLVITIFNAIPSLGPIIFGKNLNSALAEFIKGELFLAGIFQIVYTIIFIIPNFYDYFNNRKK